MRIASRFGGDAQEIVLHSGSTQDGGAKSQGDATNNTATADTNPSTALPGPSNATTISSALRNVAQIIAAGEFIYTYKFVSCKIKLIEKIVCKVVQYR